ncbi:MAG: hypothetical protein M3524_07200, partial [Actinomycetota bacterium]|nr:hypothetical protein [Actinomycetota bacterium]
LRIVQRVADATIWPSLTGGCCTARDPVAAILQAGLGLEQSRRLRFPNSPSGAGSATRARNHSTTTPLMGTQDNVATAMHGRDTGWCQRQVQRISATPRPQ